jgi:hypothetical protein
MQKRFGTVLVALAMSMGGVTVAAPAQADAPCTITNFSPRSVVVGLTPITATFKVSTTGCARKGWDLQEAGYDFYVYDGSPQETFGPWSNSDAGARDVIVSAYNSGYQTREKVFADGFSLKRRTTWQAKSFNASPEPVRKGAKISIAGRLLLADWSKDAYVPYKGRKVAVQFRTPSGAYKTMKAALTDANGWVRTTVPATATGVWRLWYGGNTVAGPAVTVGDSVQVNR